MQMCVVFLFEQLFCYERRVPPLFLGRDSGGIRPMVDLVSGKDRWRNGRNLFTISLHNRIDR